jgi:cytochrome c
MRTTLRKWSLLLGAAAVFALSLPSWAQLTKYDLETRMGMESHVGNISGHAKDGKADYRRYCVGCHGDLGDGNWV